MKKRTLSVRIPGELFDRLEAMKSEAGLDLTAIVTEALAAYAGIEIETVPDRLSKLESELAALRGKLRILAVDPAPNYMIR